MWGRYQEGAQGQGGFEGKSPENWHCPKRLVPTECGQKTGEWAPHSVPPSLPQT